jgi:ribonuclease VapC
VIVVDTSAIVAIARQEPEAVMFSEILGRSTPKRMSAASLLEIEMVTVAVKKRPLSNSDWIDHFLELASIEVEPVSVAQTNIARAAFRRYGKGTGHGAGLNFGDCFSYALAKSLDVPLLFKGGDFSKTDIASALA